MKNLYCRMLMGLIPVFAVLQCLQAQEPLFIDKEGNVYIRVKEGNKKLSVTGYAEFVDSVRARALKVESLLTSNQVKANQLIVSAITPLIDSVKLAGRLSIDGNASVMGNLFVKGSSQFQGSLTMAEPAQLNFARALQKRKINLYSATANGDQFFGFGIEGGSLRYQVDNAKASHIFYSASGEASSRELMRIDGNGNVGIGVEKPQSALEVAGNVKATSINGEKTPYRVEINAGNVRDRDQTVTVSGDIIKSYLGDDDGGTIKLICRHLGPNKVTIKMVVLYFYMAVINGTVSVSSQEPNGPHEHYLNGNQQEIYGGSWPTFRIKARSNYEFAFELESNWACTVIIYDR